MLILLIMLAGGVIAGAIASGKGRSGLGWFVIGAFFPLIGIVIVACLPALNTQPVPALSPYAMASISSRQTQVFPDCA